MGSWQSKRQTRRLTYGAQSWGTPPCTPHLAACSPPSSQVHCISTEFTPRKHGGEKGVPFRVQVDTFKQNENGEYTEHLHSASCQIKVFKVGSGGLSHGVPATGSQPRGPSPALRESGSTFIRSVGTPDVSVRL